MFSMSMMMASAGQAMDYTKFLLRPSSCITDETGTAVALDKAIYFAGANNYLSLADSADWNLGSENFTLEWYQYGTSNTIGSSGGTVLARDNTVYTPLLIFNSSIYMSSNGTSWDLADQKTIGALTINTWIHVAFVRNGNNFYIFRDGALVNSWTSALAVRSVSGTLLIGRSQGGSNTWNHMYGYLSNIRISKGIARYTTTFTPPTTITIDSYDKLVIVPTNSTINDIATYKAITKVGTPTVNLAKSAHPVATYGDVITQPLKAINWPVFFDGTGDYLSLAYSADLRFNAADFTLDYWIKRTSTANDHHIFGDGDASTSNGSIDTGVDHFGAVFFGYYYNTGQLVYLYSAANSCPVNQWVHVAICGNYSGGVTTISIFVNGVLHNTQNTSGWVAGGSTPLIIGRQGNYTGADRYFWGYLSKVRLSKGINRWTTNFNPDTIDYTVDAYTKLYINPTSAAITDTTGKTITINDSTSVTAQPNLTKVVAFDGSGDTINLGDSTDFVLGGASDWEFDFWMYPTATGYNQYIFSKSASNVASFANYAIIYDGDNKRVVLQIRKQTGSGYPTLSLGATSNSSPLNTWTHIALTSISDTLKFYINGMLNTTDTTIGDFGTFSMPYVKIGYLANGYSAANVKYFAGKLANFRLSKGTARWSSNFSPPTDVAVDASTKLLIIPSNTATITDETGKALTIVGNTQGQYNLPLADKCITFDGTGDYITVPNSADWNFGTGDFTIEFWFNPKATGTDGAIIYRIASVATDYTDRDWGIHFSTTNTIGFRYKTSTVTLQGTRVLSLGIWYHIAAVKTSSVTKLYVNGILDNSVSDNTNYVNADIPLIICASPNGLYTTGYLANLIITKGKALYTGNFTPASIL